MNSVAILFYYKRENKYSFNALAGALERVGQVKKTDTFFLNKERDILNQIPAISAKYDKVLIGISFSTPQFWEIKRLAKKIRRFSNDKILLVAGGPHPTGDPFGTLKIGFHLVVRGEGEESFIEIIKRALESKDFFGIKGISYLDSNDEYVLGENRAWINLDDYLPISNFYSKFGPIEITRGCPFACSYCQTSHIFGGKPRHRSVEVILKCVEMMKKRNLNDFRVITPNAFSYGSDDGKTLNINKLELLLFSVRNALPGDGRIFFGSFPSEVRPEHVTPETVNLVLKLANNDNLVIGGQSGSQRMLDYIRRGHDIQAIYNAADITLSAGLKANIDFIFGMPSETEEDIALTLKIIKDLARLGARVHAHTFMPLPQTRFKRQKGVKLSNSLKKEIIRLCSSGSLYGDWQKQEQIATRITESLDYKMHN
ncbi:MAG: TIGR04013 family B12-binding domain/radical SAM domain-containing protein [Candidatus Hodarchaeales archaeon]|jgi:B12-binding domain/radical SAM domain protein